MVVYSVCVNVWIIERWLTTAGDGTWILATERGRMWLTRWQSTTPSMREEPRSSGRTTFSLLSILWQNQHDWDRNKTFSFKYFSQKRNIYTASKTIWIFVPPLKHLTIKKYPKSLFHVEKYIFYTNFFFWFVFFLISAI